MQCRVIKRTRKLRSSRGSGIPPAVFGAAVQVRSPLPLRWVLSADLASPSEAAHTANVEGGGLGARTCPRSSLATEKNETARVPLCRVIAQTCSAPLVGQRPAAARGLLLATEASFAAARSLDLLGRWAGAATSHARTATGHSPSTIPVRRPRRAMIYVARTRGRGSGDGRVFARERPNRPQCRRRCREPRDDGIDAIGSPRDAPLICPRGGVAPSPRVASHHQTVTPAREDQRAAAQAR